MIGRNVYVQNVKGGMKMRSQSRMELPPPCRCCCQVADPVACDNKDCARWRSWFIRQWDSDRQKMLRSVVLAVQPVPGIPLGGRQYYHPERLMQYLYSDPCKLCYLAKIPCEEACKVRKNWEKAREEAKI